MTQPQPNDFALAMKTLSRGKQLLLLLIGLALVIQIAGFCIMQFTSLGDEPIIGESTAQATTQPTTQPTTRPAGDQGSRPMTWAGLLYWLLPASRFVALVAAFLAIPPNALATLLAVNQRVGRIQRFISAFFWSLILLAMLIPWERLFRGQVICGAMFNLHQILFAQRQLARDDVALIEQIYYFGRFLAYPGVAMLVWLIILARWRGAIGSTLPRPQAQPKNQPPAQPSRPAGD
jgi:hypothetical protein